MMDARTLAEQLKKIDAKMAAGPWKPCDRDAESPYFWGADGDLLGTAFWPCHDPTPEATRLAENQTYDRVEGITELRNLLPDIIKALQSQWIKITDDPLSLPQPSKDLYPYKPDILCKAGNQWRSATFQHGNFVTPDGWVICGVTHWQPLPAPPEEHQ